MSQSRRAVIEFAKVEIQRRLRDRLGYAVPTSTAVLAEMLAEGEGDAVYQERVVEEQLAEIQAQIDYLHAEIANMKRGT